MSLWRPLPSKNCRVTWIFPYISSIALFYFILILLYFILENMKVIKKVKLMKQFLQKSQVPSLNKKLFNKGS